MWPAHQRQARVQAVDARPNTKPMALLLLALSPSLATSLWHSRQKNKEQPRVSGAGCDTGPWRGADVKTEDKTQKQGREIVFCLRISHRRRAKGRASATSPRHIAAASKQQEQAYTWRGLGIGARHAAGADDVSDNKTQKQGREIVFCLRILHRRRAKGRTPAMRPQHIAAANSRTQPHALALVVGPGPWRAPMMFPTTKHKNKAVKSCFVFGFFIGAAPRAVPLLPAHNTLQQLLKNSGRKAILVVGPGLQSAAWRSADEESDNKIQKQGHEIVFCLRILHRRRAMGRAPATSPQHIAVASKQQARESLHLLLARGRYPLLGPAPMMFPKTKHDFTALILCLFVGFHISAAKSKKKSQLRYSAQGSSSFSSGSGAAGATATAVGTVELRVVLPLGVCEVTRAASPATRPAGMPATTSSPWKVR